MPKPMGFLMVMMEPPPTLEEEFNDWYDTEHVPERKAVAGFETATRFVCVAGWPRYVAFYDLRDVAVIDEPGYQAISGTRFSPWSKRILARVRGLYRAYGEQVYPGHALTGPMTQLLLIRFRNIVTTDAGTRSGAVRGRRAVGRPRGSTHRTDRGQPGQGGGRRSGKQRLADLRLADGATVQLAASRGVYRARRGVGLLHRLRAHAARSSCERS